MTRIERTEQRAEFKKRSETAARLVQGAHDDLVMANAAAASDTDLALNEARTAWRSASAAYSNSLNEYTRLLGPFAE